MTRGGHNIVDLTGQRFGRLVARERIQNVGGKTRWLCDCDCGNQHAASATHLRAGRIPSCGCLKREKTIARNRTHGYGNTKIHQAWADMHARCKNPKHKSFHRYGGRGISVCKEWDSFEAFLRDMGDGCAKGLALDRINNNAGYSKENCHWVTHKENCRNTCRNILFEYKGQSRTLTEWAEIYNINESTLYYRVRRRGWSLERALLLPLQPGRKAISG